MVIFHSYVKLPESIVKYCEMLVQAQVQAQASQPAPGKYAFLSLQLVVYSCLFMFIHPSHGLVTAAQ